MQAVLRKDTIFECKSDTCIPKSGEVYGDNYFLVMLSPLNIYSRTFLDFPVPFSSSIGGGCSPRPSLTNLSKAACAPVL